MNGQMYVATTQTQRVKIRLDYKGCFPQAMVRVDESLGLAIFILNIIFPGIGTLIGSCSDTDGCNCFTVAVGFL